MIWNFFYFKSIGIHSILEALQLYKSTTDVESDVAVAVVVIVYTYIVVFVGRITCIAWMSLIRTGGVVWLMCVYVSVCWSQL